MSTFAVTVVRIDDVSKHPEADRLTLVRVGGYSCISNLKDDGSWRYQPGDLAVYVPADTVIPEATLKTIGFWDDAKGKGMLAGTKGDRVKPMRLRGIFSEGILIPVGYTVFSTIRMGDGEIKDVSGYHFVEKNTGETDRRMVEIGTDVADFYGLTKYEPPIPVAMSGEVFNAGGVGLNPVKYDIEAWERFPDILREGEEVVVTEKLHGTFTGIGLVPFQQHTETFWGTDMATRDAIVYSKGLGAQGLCFKDVEANKHNLYVRALNDLSHEQRLAISDLARRNDGVHLLGETFGQGVQDLHYGSKVPVFRMFDAYLGAYPFGRYANDDELEQIKRDIGIPRVPVLYRGPYSEAVIMGLRDGKDSISDSNVREGVVVRPIHERRDDRVGRVQLKFVSPDYKLRKGKNLTENN